MTTPALSIERVSYAYPGAATPAVDEVSLTLSPGEHVALVGASGCGKTTLLRLVAGFERADAGCLRIDGRVVDAAGAFVPPEARRVAMVFQDLALFPHLTLGGNIAFGLAGRPRAEQRRRVAEMLALCALDGLDGRYPHEVSGGQRQRAALARALAPAYPVLLLDEPLSSLDPSLRADLRADLSHILKQSGVTTLVVTHDRDDALAFADRIGVMSDGRLEQMGLPRELVERPVSRRVAAALDAAWYVPATRCDGGWSTELGVVPATLPGPDGDGDLLLRQHDVQVRPDPCGSAVLVERVFHGREDRGRIRLPSGLELPCLLAPAVPAVPGERVAVTLRPASVVVFPRARLDTTCPSP